MEKGRSRGELLRSTRPSENPNLQNRRPPPERFAPNIQDEFLNRVRRERIPVAVFLVSGVKLNGRIKSFDKYSLVLETEGQEQLLFKHAVATVVAGKTAAGGAAQEPPLEERE